MNDAGQNRETKDCWLAGGYFFCLMASYYILQPLRDAMGLAGGVRNLPWLFLATMALMLACNPAFSALVARFPRQRFIPMVYRFFLSHLLLFWLALRFGPENWQLFTGRAFFLWVSVFNLFAVSVFWSFMADIFTTGEGKRWFGAIGAGGTFGQLAGSTLTAFLATRIGHADLLLISIVLLEAAVQLVHRLSSHHPPRPREEARAAKPRTAALDGIQQTLKSPYLLAICLFIFCYTFTSSFLYFAKAAIVSEAFTDRSAQTAFFGTLNTVVAGLTLVIQLGLTGRILQRFGLGPGLALVPVITLAGLGLLAFSPVIMIYAGVEILRKAGNYAVARPSREVLFTVVSRDEKYQAKNLIDTFVYRGGDALAALAFQGLTALGLGIAGLCLAGLPVALGWIFLALGLAKAQKTRESGTLNTEH